MDYLVSSGSTINDIKLSGSDTLTITDGGTVNNTSLGPGCGMFVSSGGSANITSVTGATLSISSGGTATRTLLNGDEEFSGAMHVEDGGFADVVFVSAYTNLYVYAGGTATTVVWTPCIGHVSANEGAVVELYSSYSGVYYGTGDELISSAASMAYKTVSSSEEMYVFSGGVISRTLADSFATVLISGGTAEDTTLKDGTLVIAGGVANNTVNSAGEINVSSGGILNSATILENGIIRIFDGGVATNTIASSAAINVYSGGTVSGFTISEGGGLYTGTGATLTGRMILSDDAYVSLEQGTAIIFNISALTPGAAVRINNFQLVSGWENVNYTVTISDTQAKGTYSLAIGFPAYKRTISVVNTEGTTLAALSVGETKIIDGAECTLMIEDNTLIFRKGSEEEVPERPPVVDNGSNDWLYVKKTKTLNEDLANSTPTVLNAETTDVCLDPADEIHYEENENIFLNYVGADDEFDYLKVRLEKGARLSFSLVSTDAAKFIIYSLTPGKLTKGIQAYTQKALQTTTLKKSKETGIYYTANTKGLLLEAGDYYIAVQSTARKNGNAYYSVAVNQGASVFYANGDNSDDWGDMKTAGDTSELVGTVGTISSGSASDGILSDWVGFGDAIDYKAFTIESDAIISFSLYAMDKAKFTIWKLNSKTNKKGVTTYSLTGIQTTTLSKQENTSWYSSNTGSIILDKGTYYFSMESTNAKKGGNASYFVFLNNSGTFFYTDAQENFDDSWVYDKKQKIFNPDLDKFTVTQIASLDDKKILLDGDQEISFTFRDVEYRNFAGYGDAADYAVISLAADAKLSFTVTSTGKGKFTVWRLDEKTDKKGKVTYSMKSLQATALSVQKNSDVFTCTTKSLALAAGQYYISFQSTDASRGGIAYYNVELNPAKCSGLPAGEAVSDAVPYTGPDAVAEQSAQTATSGCVDDALSAAVSAISDVQADAFLKESALLA